ncbi:MAG TPA: molybdopterin-dependent oxidoreductase [Burkholderiaceae bacterium]|nr:molybdopterin-dependent oxidoreductase [Burkholderiaceae bacterium]
MPALAAAAMGLAFAHQARATDDDTAQSCPGGYADHFVLAGRVSHRKVFAAATLQRYGSAKQNVAYFSGSSGLVQKSYIGVPLIDLLNEAVLEVDPARKNDILRKYVVIRGSDCYEAVIALGEILANFGGQQVTIAFETGDGHLLDPTEGMARVVVPGDKAGGRYVSNIVRIEVKSAPN